MKRLFILVVAGLFLATSTVMAANKIAYIDLQRILTESEEGKAGRQTMEKKAEQLKAKLQLEDKKLKDMKVELEKQSVMLSPEKKAQKEREFKRKVKEFQILAQDSQQEFRQEDAAVSSRIINEILKVVQDMGKKEGYTLILEKQESHVLYADQAINITDKVIGIYNATKKK